MPPCRLVGENNHKTKQLNAVKCVLEKVKVIHFQSEAADLQPYAFGRKNTAAYKAADVSERKMEKKKKDIISLKLQVEQMLSVETRWLDTEDITAKIAPFRLVR